MDWNLFWSAFGAIGTTIGSLITAGAVVVAVKQYKQPLEKLIKVEFTSAVSIDEISGEPLSFYCISVKNKGIREVQINSLNILGKKKKVWINNAQFDSNAKIILPVKLVPEESKDFLFEWEKFRGILKKSVEDNILKRNEKVIIMATDSLGCNYICKTNIKIKSLMKNS